MHFDTFPLCTMNLPPHGLISMLGVNLGGVQSFLRRDDERAPTELLSEVRLGLPVDTTPYWFEGKSVELSEVSFDHPRDLLLLAERAAKGDCEAVLRNVAYGSAVFLVPPHGPRRIEP